MELSIQLTRADHEPYHFGGRVCGTVKLTFKRLDHLQAVSIFFTGRTTVTLKQNQTDGMNSSPTRQSSGCLFRQHITLLRGETSLEPGEHMWPFAFNIPKYAQYCDTVQGPHGFGYFETQGPFLGSMDAEMHLLPPSFRYNGRNKCTVAYFLEARVIRPATLLLGGNQNVTRALTLNIQHRRSYGPASIACGPSISFDCQIFCFQTEPTLNVTKRLKRVLHQSEDIRATERTDSEQMTRFLQVHLETPKFIATKSQEPVKIFVRATRKVVKGPQQERRHAHDVAMELKSFSVDLIQQTVVRAGGFSASESSTFSLTRGSCSITLPCQTTTNTFGAHVVPVEPFAADLTSPKRAQDFVPGRDHISDTSVVMESFSHQVSAISCVSSLPDAEFANTSIDIGTRIRQNLDAYRAQLPYDIASAFTTYNCFRAYTLRVDLTLTYNGRTRKFQSKATPVNVIEEQGHSYTHNQCEQSFEQLLTGFDPIFRGSSPAARTALSQAESNEALPPYSQTIHAQGWKEGSTSLRIDER